MRPTTRRGYNSALLDVRRALDAALSSDGLAPDASKALRAMDAECRRLRQPTRHKPRLAAYARDYAVSLRTVKNWRKAGCPFSKGKQAVIRWMFARRTLPPGPR